MEEERRPAPLEAPVEGEHSLREDLETLRDLLASIAEFLNRLNEPLEKLLNTMLSALDGARVGEDVGNFYRKLLESGMPQEEAVKLTREYFKARVESVNIARLVRSAADEMREKGGSGL